VNASSDDPAPRPGDPEAARAGWQAQFVLLAAIWGSSFLFIKVIGEHWPPIDVALGRVALGALTLLVFLAWRRRRLPSGLAVWAHLAVAGVLVNVAPFTLIAYGETKVSSVLAGLWNATTPLFALVAILVAFGEERPDRRSLVGLGVGFVGAAVVLGPWSGLGGNELTGDLACLAAAACYGVGFPYIRRHLAGRPEGPVPLAAGQLLCSTVILAALASLASAPSTDLGVDGVACLLGVGILGSGVAYVLNYEVLAAAGATIGSTVTYVIPVFSTLLGVLVLGEPLTWNEPVGAVVVIAGIAITQGLLRPPRRAGRRRRRCPDPV
jgi:drug/metabolite transporter (DMT)-like permease